LKGDADGQFWTCRVDGIEQIVDSIRAKLKSRLPHQRKTQRGKLALLVATVQVVSPA
jgi:hypothetical protein